MLTELSAKKAILQRAEQSCGELAGELLAIDAPTLGADLNVAWEKLWKTFDNLSALAALWVWQGNKRGPMRLPQQVAAQMQLIASYDHRQHAAAEMKR